MVKSVIRKFIEVESSSGIILFIMAFLAMIIDNSRLSPFYHLILNSNISIGFGHTQFSKPLLIWINEGLMSIFFLIVGLEIKREILIGELNSVSKALLPGICAFGGMLFPAIIYLVFNWNNDKTFQGWGIPVATDIAFVMGIMALLGSRIPNSLRSFLLAIAIFDDLGAIFIIAVFYHNHFDCNNLIIPFLLILLLFFLNFRNVQSLIYYFVVAIFLWFFLLKSGIHATLAGVILAFAIPLTSQNPQKSPSQQLEKKLHPWVAFAILPLFAFANAGISFANAGWQHFFNSVSIGIFLGLFLGKQLGVFSFCWLTIKLGLGKLPHGVLLKNIYGVAVLAGVGFTMSLFIGSLAFVRNEPEFSVSIRTGVICGSLLSAIFGYMLLKINFKGGKT